MSHKDTIVEFANGVATMINGGNMTDVGQGSNGSGKSAILEGIAVAFLGEPLRDVSMKELVRNEEGEAKVILYCDNSFTNVTLQIDRIIHSNTKPSELKVYLAGELDDTITTVAHGNKKILELLGISKEDLLNYFLISKDKYQSFFNMGDTGKKKTISRFSNGDKIDPAFDLVKEDMAESEKDLLKIDTEIARCEGAIDGLETARTAVLKKEEWEVEQKRQIATAKALRQGKVASKNDEEARVEKAEKVIDETKKKLDEVEEVDEALIQKQVEAIHKCRTELSVLRVEESEVEKILAAAEKSLLGFIECPKCKHEFKPGDDTDIKTVQQKKSDAESDIKTIGEEREEWTEKKDKYATKKEKLEEEYEKGAKIERELNRYKSELEQIKLRITQWQSQITDIDNGIREMEAEKWIDPNPEIDEKIKVQRVLIKQHEDKRADIEKTVGSYEGKLTLLQRFKTYLANKAIGSIEYNINQYLIAMNSELSLVIDGYKLTSKKQIREKISTTIKRDDEDAGSLGKLSSGEKGRVFVSEILTFQQLINDNCEPGKGLDMTYLDEIIESVDSKGVSGIMKSLNDLGKTVVVVTHATFNEVYENVVTIHKIDGISQIIE